MRATILDTLHFIGTNDRNKTLFESNWPLPSGISYNSYLITDKKTALLDTIEYGSDRSYLENVAFLLDGRAVLKKRLCGFVRVAVVVHISKEYDRE